jgi:uncharacterized protein with HEPN domain
MNISFIYSMRRTSLTSTRPDWIEQTFGATSWQSEPLFAVLEVIGEAVKQIPDEIRGRYPQIARRQIAGMRDKLVHEYFGVDYDIVWDAVTNKVPELASTVRTMRSNG